MAVMVRNDEFRPTGTSTKAIAAYIDARRRERGVTQSRMARAIRDTTHPSYVSVRLAGRKAWTLDDLDAIAPLLGHVTALDLIAAAAPAPEPVPEPDPVALARTLPARVLADELVRRATRDDATREPVVRASAVAAALGMVAGRDPSKDGFPMVSPDCESVCPMSGDPAPATLR